MYTLFSDTVDTVDTVDIIDPVYLYKYFLYSGFRGYIMSKVSGILTVIVVFLLLSAFSAVSVSESDMITLKMHALTIVLLSFAGVYLVASVFTVSRGIRKMYKISKVYRIILGITDSELACTSWPEISQRVIVSNVFPWNDHLSLSSSVNTFDNYFLGMVSDDGPLSDLSVITKCTEWYIRKVVFGYTFSNSQVTSDVHNAGIYPNTLDPLTEKFRIYLIIMCVIGTLSIPGLLVYLVIHGIIRYSKEVRDRPKIMTAGTFTTYSKWKYREYNEYKNQFDRRISAASRPARKFLALQQSPVISGIRNLISFIASAALLYVVVLGTIYDSVLTDDAFLGKSGLFYIALLSAIIGIARVPAFTPVQKEKYTKHLQEFSRHTHADLSVFIGKEHTSEAAGYIRSVYRYRAVVYMIEVFSIFFIPWLGFTLYKRAPEIISFFAKTKGSFRGDNLDNTDSQKLEMSFINFNNAFGSFILN